MVTALPLSEPNIRQYEAVLDSDRNGRITVEDIEVLVLSYFCS